MGKPKQPSERTPTTKYADRLQEIITKNKISEKRKIKEESVDNKKRSRTGDLAFKCGWKNYNIATGKYDVVAKLGKTLKAARRATMVDLKEQLVSTYLCEEKLPASSSFDIHIARNDNETLPEEIEGVPFTFDRWRQLVTNPVRLYIYTKVSEDTFIISLYNILCVLIHHAHPSADIFNDIMKHVHA